MFKKIHICILVHLLCSFYMLSAAAGKRNELLTINFFGSDYSVLCKPSATIAQIKECLHAQHSGSFPLSHLQLYKVECREFGPSVYKLEYVFLKDNGTCAYYRIGSCSTIRAYLNLCPLKKDVH